MNEWVAVGLPAAFVVRFNTPQRYLHTYLAYVLVLAVILLVWLGGTT